MKTLVLLIGILAVTHAGWIENDLSQARPIEDFDHYWARLPADLQYLRQLLPERRITNGQEANPGQFPYLVAILSTIGDGTLLCGGSILTENFILTAAQCVQNALGGTAIMGAHNRIQTEPSQQRIAFNSAGIRIHPAYDPINLRNGIATIRLNSPITFNDRVQPIRIPSGDDERSFADMTGTVSGFGRTSDDSTTSSPVVMFTSNPIITQADCLAQWGGITNVIHAQNICLSPDDGRSFCYGDFGGPLTVEDQDGDSLLVGIASFISTAGCVTGRPSGYVRVTHFTTWIMASTDL